MKTNEIMRPKADESCFLAALVIFELLVLPSLPLGKYGGGIAMFVVGALGLPAYLVLYRERLRSRGQIRAFIMIAVASMVVAFAAALVVALRVAR